MRRISASLEAKLRNTQQTRANNSDPSLDLWIGRPTTALTDDAFLERQNLPVSGGITRTYVAVAHPIPDRSNTSIYIAYIQNGFAHVAAAAHKAKMSAHVWADTGFSAAAEDVAVAFDATMKNDTRGRSEFVTEERPWVFWVSGGALYGRKLGSADTITLAEANCTKCTAIRAAGSAMGGFDYGLCLFFLLNGAIYVRQLIGSEWMDAEPIGFGPDAVWTDIAASRSWDYRVILQAMASDGTVYEMYTQYMGIGQRSVEHIEVKSVSADGELTGIRYADTTETEHIEVAGIDAGALYGGLYATGQPSFLSAQNVPVNALDDDGVEYQDWGKVVLVALDVHLEPASVASNAAQFTLTDSKGQTFVAASAEPINDNGLTLRLTFADFNAASGACALTYTPGTVATMYGLTAESMSVVFTPENLVAPAVEAPTAVEAWPLEQDGTKIAVRFTEEIMSGADTTDGWTVTIPEYDYVPGGTMSHQERQVTEITGFAGTIITFDLSEATLTDTQLGDGAITLEVSE